MLRMGRNDHWTKASLRRLDRPTDRRAGRINKFLIIKVISKNLAGRIMCAAAKLSGSFTNKVRK
jgi:hypothetical protein